MEQKIKDLLAKNKFIFFILIPLLLIIKGRNIIIDFLLSDAKKVDSEAKKKDVTISDQIKNIDKQTDAIEKDMADDKTDAKPIDEDWYLKKEDK